MKIKVEQAITLINSLGVCANEKNLDSKVSYGIARNIMKLKPIIKEFNEANEARVESYCKKDDKGEKIIIEGRYDFGNSLKEADEKYKELLSEEKDFEPFIIKRSDSTDALPVAAQIELLDIIIIEEPK